MNMAATVYYCILFLGVNRNKSVLYIFQNNIKGKTFFIAIKNIYAGKLVLLQ